MAQGKTIAVSDELIQVPSGNSRTTVDRAEAVGHRRMDINSATSTELRRLVGIGVFYANRIVKGRPYRQGLDLVDRRILPLQTYDRMKDEIEVGAWDSIKGRPVDR